MHSQDDNPRKDSGTKSATPAQLQRQIGTLVFGFAFLLFSLLLYLPSEIYFSNLNEFTLRLNDLVLIFLPAWSVSVLFGVGLAMLLPRAVKQYLVAIVFALGLLFWIQGSLLVWRYGSLDGSDIDWSSFYLFGVIDTPIWLLILVLAIKAPAAFMKGARPAAYVVLAIQSTLILYSAVSSQETVDDASARNYRIDNSAKYSYSASRNVVVFVLDAFQSDIFAEIISEEPDYGRSLEGFTYFPDAVSGSNYTELAIPALLTGRIFDNSRPREEFLREAFLEYGVTTNLKRQSYVVDIYPWVGWGNESIYFDDAIASNLSKIDARVQSEPTFSEKKAKEALHLLDLSLFRAAPHFIKKYVYNEQRWLAIYIASFLVPDEVKNIIATDNQFEFGTFLRQAPQVLATDRGQNVFKYYHLKGAHSPLTVDQELNFTDQTLPFSKENYINQAKANLIALEGYLDRLKHTGIYDGSLILILGDHGSGDSPEMYIEPTGASREPFRLDGTKRNFRRDKAKAIPLVLIKRIGASGPLETLNAPVSTLDVPATVISELGLENSDGRTSMFEVDPAATTVRYHSAFQFSPNKGEYVADITVYRIEGDSWVNESWTVDEIRSRKPQQEP